MKKLWNFGWAMYHKYEEMVNYLIGGVLSTIVNWLAYVICSRLFHLHYMTSTVIAFIIGLIFAYIVNKLLVFKSKDFQIAVICKEFALFTMGRVASLVMEMGMMYAFVDLLHMYDLIAKFICLIFVMITNYLFSKLLVFKEKH